MLRTLISGAPSAVKEWVGVDTDGAVLLECLRNGTNVTRDELGHVLAAIVPADSELR